MPVGVEAVRGVQWGTDYDWELKFNKGSGLTKPFDEWFPAVEVDDALHDIESQSFDLANATASLPKGVAETPLRITFHDDYKGTLEKWLLAWMKKIADFNKGVLPLDESTKIVSINRLAPYSETVTGLKKVLDTKTYRIYPNGTFSDNKSQNSKAKVFSMEFKIVG